jgi:hypothetical protein
MKRTANLMIMVFLIASISTTAWAGKGNGRGCCGGGNGQGQSKNCGQGNGSASFQNLPLEDLSSAEEKSLVLMREEEKLARDVYLTLDKQYNNQVFANIAQAEQRHMDRVGNLLARYEVTDPVTSDEIGSFNSEELQKLYNDLVAQGAESLEAAMVVGATIEDLDINDLNIALAEDIDNQDIKMVYANLAKGSRNHMRAFSAQLKENGTVYTARFISQEELSQIIDSDWERGPAQGKGQGQKQGRGNGKGKGQGRGTRCG